MRPALRYLGIGVLLFVGSRGLVALWPNNASDPSDAPTTFVIAASAQPQPAGMPSNTVVQAFPVKGFDSDQLPYPDKLFDSRNYPKRETAWVVEWDITNPQGGSNPPSSILRITKAHFGYLDREGKWKWITVAENIELGEIFVPYDDASHQYEDIAEFTFRIRPADEALLGPPCLAPGKILKSDQPGMSDLVYKEVHDDGVRLIDNRTKGLDKGRRGEKLMLWVNFYASNYRYIIEYSFSDDGVIGCRIGGTAQNLNNRKAAPRLGDTHLHVGCWMFEPHLGDPTNPNNGGPDKNIVRLVRRVPVPEEPSGHFHIAIDPFPAKAEQQVPSVAGSARWNPDEFTTLRVQSTVRKNGSDKPQSTSYDLVPVRSGSCRSFPSPRYDYATHDFWVTPARPGLELLREVAEYTKKHAGPVDLKHLLICHNTPLLHVARGEDFGTDGVSCAKGAALISWAGFMLKPRDLFDGTPLLPK